MERLTRTFAERRLILAQTLADLRPRQYKARMAIIDPVQQLAARVGSSGFTMRDVCERAGVAQSTPSRWRSGRADPKFSNIRKLDQALDDLIAGSTSIAV